MTEFTTPPPRRDEATLTWSAGPHHGIASTNLIAVIGQEVPLAELLAWWDRAAAGPDAVAELVACLDRHAGVPAAIAVLPADPDGHDVRLVLRGAGHAAWTRAGVPDAATSTGAGLDRVVTGEHLTLGITPVRAEPGLPTLGGLLPADAVRWEASSPAAPDEGPAAGAADPIDTDPVDPDDQPSIGEFEDLWGEHTVMALAEDAAVRHPTGEHEGLVGAAPSATGDTGNTGPLVTGPVPDPVEPARFTESTWHSTESPQPVTEPVPTPPTPAPAPTPPPPAAAQVFISEVPSATPPAVPPAPPASPPPVANLQPPPAPVPVPAHGAVEPEPEEPFSDHDGHTRLQPWVGSAVTTPETVLATVCARGHANPPSRPTCRICADPLTGPAQQVVRPDLGRLVASNGVVVPLDGTILVGRSPRATVTASGALPRTVVLPDAHVSAHHLELRVEGWNLLVRDVGSTNGTFLRRHGKPPVRLPETLQLVVAGDVIDLGHGVHLRFEELA